MHGSWIDATKYEVIIRRATPDDVIRKMGEVFNMRKDLMTTKQSH